MYLPLFLCFRLFIYLFKKRLHSFDKWRVLEIYELLLRNQPLMAIRGTSVFDISRFIFMHDFDASLPQEVSNICQANISCYITQTFKCGN